MFLTLEKENLEDIDIVKMFFSDVITLHGTGMEPGTSTACLNTVLSCKSRFNH